MNCAIESTQNEHGYTIKEASEKLNLSQYTLRYYEKEGLVSGIKRCRNGRRLYNEKDILWIHVIQLLRKSGASTTHIKEYNTLILQGNKSIPKRYEVAFKQKQTIENQILKYQELLGSIEDELQYLIRCMDIK